MEPILKALGITITRQTRKYIIARCVSGRHPDNNPSWVMWLDGDKRGEHHCYSCKWGGSLIGLVMHQLGCDAEGAKHWLKTKGWKDSQQPISSVLVNVSSTRVARFKVPNEVQFLQLGLWPEEQKSYWVNRGLTAEQVQRWSIGFACVGRLWGRVVLVTRDNANQPVNYAARSIYANQTRYLYPSSEEHPNMGAMFGEERWPPEPLRQDVFVVEGAINAISIDSVLSGGASVAAIGGSNVTPMHVVKLSTFHRVFVVTDNDHAGDRAWSRLENSFGRLANLLCRVILPKGEDAQSVDKSTLGAAIAHAKEEGTAEGISSGNYRQLPEGDREGVCIT